MNIKKLLNEIKPKPPCETCLYKLGMIKYVVSPCPACKANGYNNYAGFLGDTRNSDDTPQRD
ncbi:MAG: hypothetical protein FWG68_08700 [Defluviitaleaceae bacterium]|nr:hypothetical protein [Defluviitaleaceae bacterium]